MKMGTRDVIVRVMVSLPDQLDDLLSIAIQVGVVLHVPRLFDLLSGSQFLLI